MDKPAHWMHDKQFSAQWMHDKQFSEMKKTDRTRSRGPSNYQTENGWGHDASSFGVSRAMKPKFGPDEEETRVTDPDTGAQKGSKRERFDLIPAESLNWLARVYGYGAGKYDDHNWRRGYAWGLSYAAMQRHLHAFWSGENFDPESGLPHLAHAMWHCTTLLTFMTEHPEKDDRYAGV